MAYPIQEPAYKGTKGEYYSTGCSDKFVLIRGMFEGPYPVDPLCVTFAVVGLGTGGWDQRAAHTKLLKEGWTEVCRFPSSHPKRGIDKNRPYELALMAHQATGDKPEVIKVTRRSGKGK